MTTLYELGQARQSILDRADELDEQTLIDTLESIDEAFDLKIENTAKLIKSLKNDVETFKTEEKRLAERRRTIENNVKRIETFLEEAMLHADVKKVKGDTLTVAIQKGPVSLKIDSEADIPRGFYIEQEPKLNKKELLAEMKDGLEVSGVELKQSEGLRIR